MSATADRLAQGFIAKQGYVAGTVDEATALIGACDFILTKHDGLSFSMVCIVDAAKDANRRFEFAKDAAKDILAACCDRYSGTVGGAKQPAALVIVEVRPSAAEDDVNRLRSYSNQFFDRNAIHAFVVDCSTKRVVTATRFSFLAGWGWRRFLRREMALPE